MARVRQAVQKCAKSMKPFGFTSEAKNGKNPNKTRNTATATTLQMKKQLFADIFQRFSIFFRPTPLGFRQVVQHVRLHVAEISELIN